MFNSQKYKQTQRLTFLLTSFINEPTNYVSTAWTQFDPTFSEVGSMTNHLFTVRSLVAAFAAAANDGPRQKSVAKPWETQKINLAYIYRIFILAKTYAKSHLFENVALNLQINPSHIKRLLCLFNKI